ncbi:MAG: hypothetical protein WCF94_02000 [bacterium]
MVNKVTFENKPWLSPHEVDRKFNERREKLPKQIEEYILSNPLFKSEDVSVYFFQTSVSSLVCLLRGETKKLVLKIPLSLTHAPGEGLFFKVWEKAGVKVPHVFEEGVIGDGPYLLMEFIDADTLSAAEGKGFILKNKEEKLGRILRMMHVPLGHGYGRCLEGHGEHQTFVGWLEGEEMAKKISYIKEHDLIGDECGELSKIIKILADHTKAIGHTSYCHDDYGGSNIFATDPPTVFDPVPRFNDGYIDLGKVMFGHMLFGGTDETRKEFLKGYFGDEKYDHRVLQAATVLAAYMKFSYWHRSKKEELMKRGIENLIRDKHLLD